MRKIKAKKLTGVNKIIGKLKYDGVVYFQTRFGVHTFGMKEAIDVLVLDDEFRVVAKRRLKPNRIFLWNPRYKNVVEGSIGTINKLDVQDKLKIEF